MAINTIGVTLKWGTTPITTKKVDIKTFPDLGGAPDVLDATTHSNTQTSNILGLPSQATMEFDMNYTKADYQTVKTDARSPRYYALYLGQSEGAEGVFTWEGQHDIVAVAKGVNEVMEAKIIVAPSTPIRIAHDLVSGTIDGTPNDGVPTALSMVYSPVSPSPTPYLAYQWQKTDLPGYMAGEYDDISGATNATYTPLVGDLGAYLRCKVTAGGSAIGTIYTPAKQVI